METGGAPETTGYRAQLGRDSASASGDSPGLDSDHRDRQSVCDTSVRSTSGSGTSVHGTAEHPDQAAETSRSRTADRTLIGRLERGSAGDGDPGGPGSNTDAGTAVAVHALIGPADAGGREARTFTADAIVLATGAHDRTLPFPGWHLPGVFTAGAAQALAKGERIAVGRRVVVAGAGPFLLPVAQSLTAAGADVLGVFEAARPAALAKGWLPRPWRLLAAAHKGAELAGYAAHHLAGRVPYRLGRAVVEARGDGRVEEVVIARLDADWTPVPGTERTVTADAACVSHGFTPRLELSIAAGCEIGPDRFVTVDDRQRTSVANVYAAGEITGIGGVDAALAEGRIAGRSAAGSPASRADLRRRDATADFARRIDAAHGIRPGWTAWLRDDTVVCRCEEVAYGPLRDAAAATRQTSLRSLKLTTRAGLGICQARMCGRTVEDLTGAGSARAEDTTDRRPLAAPIRLGDLAGLATTWKDTHV
ncbi:pyridine nucleotide-disulfide oxidoreductase [Glycomyces sp. NEAU-7082]|uniref:Pyridine nucleotide-disulfide oxidoreductase n=1 Tax=Glycomyces albidus TaxID=2656774 RepID=A0A6L5GE27_9ACTN|nr:pyridine nucleotide-disulfide oxidoreductase [Glycomyces albidus]